MPSMSTISPSLKIGLRMIGMWPDVSHGTIYWLLYMVSLVVMQYFQFSYVYSHLDPNNLQKIMDGLGLTLDYTLTILKLICLWFNRGIFADILAAMDDDWNDCASELHECMMIDKANLAHRCSNVMMSINAVATVLYFVDSQVRGRMVSEDGQYREFPIQVQLPFEVQESPTFEFVMVGLFFHVLETATVIAMLNALVLTLVLHVSGQIDIMCEELKAIPSTCESNPSSTKSLVRLHQKIISTSNNIENFLSLVALLQFVWNTLVICSIGFMVVISRSIGDAAYEAVWYNLSTSECRILLFVILRSQKRLTITAGKVMDLSLEGFTSVMKASASYISVLHAMY